MQTTVRKLDLVSENLRSLAQHLDDIAAGSRPTADDLANAPVLDEWVPKLTATQAPAIRGSPGSSPY